MAFKTNPRWETAEEEQARLATAPDGSTMLALSAVPVNLDLIGHRSLEGLLILLPAVPALPTEPSGTNQRRMIVAPIERQEDADAARLSHTRRGEDPDSKFHRHTRSWACAVIASDDERYPVGGWRVMFPEWQLIRGTRITLEGHLS